MTSVFPSSIAHADTVDSAVEDVLNEPYLSVETSMLVSQVFQSLADPTRARMLYALTKREHTVGELSEITATSQSATSHQLKHLRDVRIVKTRRDGNKVHYSVDDTHVATLFREALHHVAHVMYGLPDHPLETQG